MRNTPACVLFCPLFLALAPVLPAQAKPQLLTDINRTSRYRVSSYPTGKLALPDRFYEDKRFIRVGRHLFFSATTAATGYELFCCTESRGSAVLAADINPGTGSSNPSDLLTLGGKLYFEATDGVNGYQIFEAAVGSGGVTVRSLTNLPGTSGPGYMVGMIGFKKHIFFTFYDTVAKNHRIHKLDPVTKTLVKLSPALQEGWKTPVDLGGHIVFEGRDHRGREAWWLDGDKAGVITDYSGGDGWCRFPVVVGGIVYFSGYTGSWEILKWGPKLGVKKVTTLPAGVAWEIPVVAGTTIFFGAPHAGYSRVHVLDTASATPRITIMPHESNSAQYSGMNTPVVMGGKLYYYAYSNKQNPAGHYLHCSDGVTAYSIPGTRHYYTGTNWINPVVMEGATPAIFFRFQADGAGNSLYRFDGTRFGLVTRIQVNLYRGANPWYLTQLGNKVLFQADDGRFGSELWESDGTAAGTTVHTHLGVETRTNSSSPGQFVALGRKLYFTADDGVNGNELWVVDTNPPVDLGQGARLVVDLNPGAASANPRGLVGCEAMRKILFHADDGTGVKPFVLDGDTGKVMPVAGKAKPTSTGPGWAFAPTKGDYLVAHCRDIAAGVGSEFYAYDPSKNLFGLVADTNKGPADGEVKEPVETEDGGVAFLSGNALFFSRGTPQTTTQANITGITITGDMGSYKKKVVFSAKDSTGKPGAYAYDRKTRTTTRFHTAATPYERALVDPFEAAGRLYYTATISGNAFLYGWDGLNGSGLRVSTSSLYRLEPFHTTQTGKEEVSVPFGLDGGKLFFPMTPTGVEVWKADASGAKPFGTTLFSAVDEAISLGAGRVAVVATTANQGKEVYVIDDTRLAIAVSEPLAPGYASGAGSGGLWALAGRLVFPGYEYSGVGREPFTWATGALAQSYGASGARSVRMAATDPVLGRNLALEAHPGTMTPAAVLFLLAHPTLLPLRIGDNRFYLNLTNLMVTLGALHQGVGTLPIPVPADTGLIGLNVDGQAIVVDAALTLGLSQAMSFNLGR